MIFGGYDRAKLAAAVFGAAAFALSAQAADKATGGPDQEKCYGIAKARDNNCAAGAKHACAGQAKASYEGHDFKEVPKGSCEKMRGMLAPFEGMNMQMMNAPAFSDG